MNEMYKEADYSYYATRTALKDYQMSLIFKNKILKNTRRFWSSYFICKSGKRFC